MNYALTLNAGSFDMTLQTTNRDIVLAALELAERTGTGYNQAPQAQLEQAVTKEGAKPMFSLGTLADIFAKEEAKNAFAQAAVIAEGPEILPPPAKAAKATPAKKTAPQKAAAPVLVPPPVPAKEAVVDVIQIPSGSPSAELTEMQNEVSDRTLEAIKRNRPAVIELFAEFGAQNYSGIKYDMDKLKAFRARVIEIQAPQAAQ